MPELRLGDVIDDYCIKCRRLTNHAIVSLLDGQVAKVRCRSCYHDHNYLHEIAPPSKKDLKKAELFNAVLSQVDPSVAPAGEGTVEVEEEPVPEPEATPVETAPTVARKSAGAKKAANKTAGRTKKA
jgi:hypothetical protein